MWHDSILVSKVKSLQPSQGDSEGPSGPVLEEWFELFFELGVMVGR